MNNFLNNGKVLIGSRYDENPLKPKYIEQDEDMILIQSWFIGDNKAARRRHYANLAYIVLLVIAGVFMLLSI